MCNECCDYVLCCCYCRPQKSKLTEKEHLYPAFFNGNTNPIDLPLSSLCPMFDNELVHRKVLNVLYRNFIFKHRICVENHNLRRFKQHHCSTHSHQLAAQHAHNPVPRTFLSTVEEEEDRERHWRPSWSSAHRFIRSFFSETELVNDMMCWT